MVEEVEENTRVREESQMEKLLQKLALDLRCILLQSPVLGLSLNQFLALGLDPGLGLGPDLVPGPDLGPDPDPDPGPGPGLDPGPDPGQDLDPDLDPRLMCQRDQNLYILHLARALKQLYYLQFRLL